MPESSFTLLHLAHARHIGRFYCLMSSLILKTMNHGRAQWQSWYSRVPTQPTDEMKIGKCMILKQIKICAGYRHMLPKILAGLSGTPRLRPIGLSPGSWQTRIGLGYHVPVFCTDLNLHISGLIRLSTLLLQISYQNRKANISHMVHYGEVIYIWLFPLCWILKILSRICRYLYWCFTLVVLCRHCSIVILLWFLLHAFC